MTTTNVPLHLTRFTVTRYEGSARDIQAAIIEADWDLIGLGFMDLSWDEFVSELLTERGYEKFSSSPSTGNRFEVDVWRRIPDEAVAS